MTLIKPTATRGFFDGMKLFFVVSWRCLNDTVELEVIFSQSDFSHIYSFPPNLRTT